MAKSERVTSLRAALLSTFTVDPLVPYLGTALEDARLPAKIFVGPYDQIVQQCFSDESETALAHPDVLLCWARLEDLWAGAPLPLEADETTRSRFGDALLGIAESALAAARRWRASLVLVMPSVPEERPLGIGDACNRFGVSATASAVREALRARLGAEPGVLLVDAEDAVRTVGTHHAYDPRKLALARIPYSEALFCALGTQAARLIALSRRAPRKVVIVDGDNTLWRGVVGEVGPQNVDLRHNGPGEAHRAFQSYLLELRRGGVLLALCSKNDEIDVWRVFERPEMRLKREHLAAWRIGWSAKSVFVRELSAELGLATDSFVFIDDNPAEIAEVSAAVPDIGCILMPSDPAMWREALDGAALLDRLPPTEEDLARPASYEQERQRAAARIVAASPEEYLSSMKVTAEIFSARDGDLPRLSQLIAKTNQFNLNCRRRTEAEVAMLVKDERAVVRLVRTKDRFGDYGIVGAYVLALENGTASLDTFLLSCRTLGRGVEQAMLADAFEELSRRAIPQLIATVEAQSRNEPARLFFGKLGRSECGVPGPLARVEWPKHVSRA